MRFSLSLILSGWFWEMVSRSEEHTSELQARAELVCRLLLEKKKREKNVGVGAGYPPGGLAMSACGVEEVL